MRKVTLVAKIGALVALLAFMAISNRTVGLTTSRDLPVATIGTVDTGAPTERGPAEWAAAANSPVPAWPAGVETNRRTAPVPAAVPAGPKSGATDSAVAAPPTLKGLNFNGLNESACGGYFPGDEDSAVGKANFVQVDNVCIRIYTKGGVIQSTVSLNAFFGYSTQVIFDPRVIFDPTWNRFVITGEAFQESSTVQLHWIAVSKTGNPLGGWWIYSLNVTFVPGDFFDFPQLGMDQDALIFTANNFRPDDSCYGDSFAFAKATMYNGFGGSSTVFFLPCTTAPPFVLDGNANAYFLSANDGLGLHMYRGNNLSNPGYQTLVLQAEVVVPAYSPPPLAHQPGTTAKLETLDGRFEQRSYQYGDSLWNVHTIALGPFPAPRFYEIDTEGAGANTLKQGGFFFASATSDDFNASIAANTGGEAFVTWTSTDTATQAQVRYSGRMLADTLGVIPAGAALFTSPTFSLRLQGCCRYRWGDYSSVSLDPSPYPVVPCAPNRRAWISNETNVFNFSWGTRIGRIGFC